MKGNDVLSLLLKSKEENLFVNLLKQLEKDFHLANISFKLPDDISPENLVVLVKEKLYVLLMERFDEYLNLLYVIDVSENVLKKIEVVDAVDVAEKVSFLVLKREYDKVHLKRKYGRNS